jgi:hypothetical protein
MNQTVDSPNVWGQILSGLVGGAVFRPNLADRNAGDLDASRSGASKTDSNTVTVAWHDSTSCHYDDQHWHRAKAAHEGICAISGTFIAQGADIYRPSRCSHSPVNAGAMILTDALPPLPKVDGAADIGHRGVATYTNGRRRWHCVSLRCTVNSGHSFLKPPVVVC